MKFLLILLLILFFIVGVFGSLIGMVLKFMRGGMNNTSKQAPSAGEKSDSPPVRKQFAKDEGEYVHYEEIKDDN